MSAPVDFGRLMQTMGQQLEVLPVGSYDVVVKQATAGTTNSGDKPQIKVKFAVESGPHAGRTLWNNFTISQENPNALLIFFTQMKAMGLTPEFFAAGPSLETVAQQLEGKRARVDVAHRTWQGAQQPNITRVNPAIGGPLSAPSGLGAIPGAPAPVATPPAPPVAASPLPVVAPVPPVIQAPPPVASVSPAAPAEAPAPSPIAPEVVQATVTAAAETGNAPGTEQVESPLPPAPPQPEAPAPAPAPVPQPAPPQEQVAAPAFVAPQPVAPEPQPVAQAPAAPLQPQTAAATAATRTPPGPVPF
jgi:hypothetical protein